MRKRSVPAATLLAAACGAALALDGGALPDGAAYKVKTSETYRIGGSRGARLRAVLEGRTPVRGRDTMEFLPGREYRFLDAGANGLGTDGTYVESSTDVIDLTPAGAFEQAQRDDIVSTLKRIRVLPKDDGDVNYDVLVLSSSLTFRSDLRSFKGTQKVRFTAVKGTKTLLDVTVRTKARGKRTGA